MKERKRMSVNWIDIVLAIPTLYLIYKGWRHGLIREVSTLVGLLLGIWAALHLSQWTAEQIGLEGDTALLVAFFITFVGAIVLANLLGKCIEGLFKAVKIGTLNRLAGSLLGMLKALCILAVLLNYITMIDKEEQLIKPEVKQQSMLYSPVYRTGNKLTKSIKEYATAHADEWKKKITN